MPSSSAAPIEDEHMEKDMEDSMDKEMKEDGSDGSSEPAPAPEMSTPTDDQR